MATFITSSPVVRTLVNWTAWRFKFRRSRRMQLVAFVLLLLVSVTAAQQIGRLLAPGPPPTTGTNMTEPPPPPPRINITDRAPEWRVGDYWVWEDGYGLRVVDRVVAISYAGSVPLYEVRRESSAMDGRDARVENVTFDSRTLAVRRVAYPASNLTVEWEQRTLGLTYAGRSAGFSANATLTWDNGRPGSRFLRVSNVTSVTTARVDVPAGEFDDVTYVQGRFQDYNLRDPDKSRVLTWGRWFSPAVGNDAAFRLPNGTIMKLVAYRSVNGLVPAPPMEETPSWREGATWTYRAPDDTERRITVVDAQDGIITVEDVRGQAGGRRVRDTAQHRSDDLAPFNYTLLGARFEMEPAGAPLAPTKNVTWPYVKWLYIAGGPFSFEGNLTVNVTDGPTLRTPAGTFQTRIVVVTEEERDAGGRPAVFRTVRYYAPEIGRDARMIDTSGVTWTLESYDLPTPPFRWDSLPPPL